MDCTISSTAKYVDLHQVALTVNSSNFHLGLIKDINMKEIFDGSFLIHLGKYFRHREIIRQAVPCSPCPLQSGPNVHLYPIKVAQLEFSFLYFMDMESLKPTCQIYSPIGPICWPRLGYR